MEERRFSAKIMGRNGGNFIAMFDYPRKNAMDGSSHVFPATQNNHFRRKWLCQPMACRHMVAEAEAIRGLHLANETLQMGDLQNVLATQHRSMEEPKKFSIHLHRT